VLGNLHHIRFLNLNHPLSVFILSYVVILEQTNFIVNLPAHSLCIYLNSPLAIVQMHKEDQHAKKEPDTGLVVPVSGLPFS
jgi:hypothetical protein